VYPLTFAGLPDDDEAVKDKSKRLGIEVAVGNVKEVAGLEETGVNEV